MSQRKDGTRGIWLFGLVSLALILAAKIVIAVLIALTLYFTIVSVLSWNKRRCIWGLELGPRDARWFVYRGIIGAIGLPGCVLTYSLFYELNIHGPLWWWLALGGYTGATVCRDLLVALLDEEQPGGAAAEPPSVSADTPAQIETRNIEPVARPFHYASWDDEEIRR